MIHVEVYEVIFGYLIFIRCDVNIVTHTIGIYMV